MNKGLIDTIGLTASVILPLWNIPLIVRIVKRKSSKDVSLWWVFGVWGCLVFMAPSGFTSSDIVWKTFNIVNLVFFTCVLISVVKYRNGTRDG